MRTHNDLFSDTLEQQRWILTKLQRMESLVIATNADKPGVSASAVVAGIEIFVPLEGLIDLGKEKDRILKEIQRLESFKASIEAKLSNEKFMGRAPEDVVQNERNKARDTEQNLEKLREQLSELN
jgi:valyl-tRNA synthetase